MTDPTGTPAPPTGGAAVVAGLRATIADLVDRDPSDIDAEDNVFELGLDSIALMRLVGGWRRGGADVTFADLAAAPTLAAWASLLGASPTPASPTPASGPRAAEGDGAFPLGLMQHAYWAGRGSGTTLGGVGAHLYVEFDTPGAASFDAERLHGAIATLAARHPMLRMRITPDGTQTVGDLPSWRGLDVHDLTGMPADAAAAALEEQRAQRSHRVLDIEGGEVFAAALSMLPGGGARLHLDVDMAAADAVSYRLLVDELAALVADPHAALPAIGYTYREYLRDRPAARAEQAARAAAWWRERLPGLPGAPDLSLADPVDTRPRVRRRHMLLPDARFAALRAAAHRRGLTPAATLAAVFAEVVGHWGGPRYLLNVPLFDRAPVHPDVGRVVGDFSSSVLLEVDLTVPETAADRVARTQARLHADAGRADHSGVEVLRDLSRHRGEQVLAPVVFTSALSLGQLFSDAVLDTFGDPVWIVSQGPQVLLDAQVTELRGGLLVNWDCREERCAPGVLDAMFDAFTTRVTALAADDGAWDRPLADGLPELAPRARPAAGPAQPRERVAPRTALEQVVAHVWSDVLGVAEVAVHDELVALGGDSVLAVSIVAGLRDALDTPSVTVRHVFAAPTVAGLAALLTAEASESGEAGRLEEVAEVYLEIAAMSDEDVAAQLEAAP